MIVFTIWKHGKLKAITLTRENAIIHQNKIRCDGSNDGRCADWQDDGHNCNEIREIQAIE